MTREEFLNGEWQKYPVFSAAAASSDWILGRVQNIAPEGGLHIGGDVVEVQTQPVTLEALGVSIPVSLLQSGDVIAYNATKKCVFLLAPNTATTGIIPTVEWQMFLQVVHDFFAKDGFIHWLTPSFVQSAGVDANIDFFYAVGARTGRQYRLPTSPEFELKKAMVQGVERLYEIKKCFRDDDKTPIHNCEFTMLEWYRAFSDLRDIEADVLGLINYVIETFALPFEPFGEFSKFTIKNLFKTYLDFDLSPQTTARELQSLLERDGLDWSETDDWNDLFFRVYVDRIEPQLAALGAIVVTGFPPQQRSLARLTADGWADRFEFYWNGVEIANAYHEENNPQMIETIIDEQMKSRARNGRAPITKDAAFVEMMKMGLPPSAGIALGLERLFMCLRGKSDINE